ncbi:hypothetical protein HHI36_007064 [Cryptolaemus montrouzieri]|uniref:Ion transport domain-containing protein n=1 Tax=Cryptolaemus montrouzieri TaxID=559131 RepID=A0ABD2MNF4_9CUCU
MDNRKTLSRTNSICPSPEEVLLELVKTNKQEKIRTLIEENEALLSFTYSYPYFGKILYISCIEFSIKAETIKTLLELGAKPTDGTEDQGEIIHVAARSTRSDVLEVVTKYLTQEEVNHTFKGNNALLILIKEGDYKRKSELLDCAKILINCGINVNHVDAKNFTAILWAIKKECLELIQILSNNSSDLDIDTFKLDGKSAREHIVSKYPSEVMLPNVFTNKASPKELLFYYLKAYNEEDFINFNKGDIYQYKDSDNGTYTLLQLSCQLGLVKAVRHLIDNRSDIRKTTEKQPFTPIELASENGFFEIVELLMDQDHTLKVSSTTLTTLLNRMNISDVSNDNYEKCFDLLLKNQDEVSLNTENALTQTPLHLAVKFAKPKQVLELLKKGSSLAYKNQFDIMPIEYIDAEVLEKHLDDCVEMNDIDKNNINVTLNYRTLLPFPLKKHAEEEACCEEGNNFVQNTVPETDAIAYMCKAPHLKYLLTHPVIVTFLLLKWYKVHRLFLSNLIYYTIFLSSLLGYIFASYGNFHYIPVNESFLSPIASISHIILSVTFIILLLRELFQILVSPLNYYRDLDNWIEVILIFIVGSILFINEPSNDTRKQLASIAILLSAFELVLMMGQHPRLTTNVVMFKRVSFNFVKFLAWYFLLIAAFAMSFYILFSESTDDDEQVETSTTSSGEKKEEETNFFMNPGVALFKTLVMLTGEFDASDMNFHSFPITSKVIFILFVLMIALILLNLLNGLAVSDTQTIKNDAECVGLIARTEHIHYIECMVLGNILPTTVLNICQKLCCCLPFYEDLTVILGQPLSKYISLYPKTHVTVPLSNDVEMMNVDKKGSKRESAVSIFNSFYLDKEIRRKIKEVIQKQKMQTSDGYLRNKIKKLKMNKLIYFWF